MLPPFAPTLTFMNDKINENMERLKERSEKGLMPLVINSVTPLKPTIEKIPEEDYEDIISSVFDD